MSNVIDDTIAMRILYLLVLPFNKWKAYEEGIIDKDGKILHPKSKSDNWTMLHRLVARLKILLGKIPGGKSVFATTAAAYLLVKEHLENEDESILFETRFFTNKYETEALEPQIKKAYEYLLEDGMGVTAVAGVGADGPGDTNKEPPVDLKDKKKAILFATKRKVVK